MGMLFDDIKNTLSADFSGDFTLSQFGERAVYITGTRGVKSFSKTEVVLFLKRGALTVKGENLEIKKICRGDAVICGKITSVSKT